VRPVGWRAANDVPDYWTRPGHLYRGVTEDEFYDRARRAAERIARVKKMPVEDVVDQLDREARRRGPIMPMPGKDI
jgi:hypothetical protein